MRKLAASFLLFSTGLLAACESVMDGVVRDEGTRVQFQYEPGSTSDSYKAVIDNENFVGLAVQAEDQPEITTKNAGDPMLINTSRGNVMAILFGEKGSALRCNMTYLDSIGRTNSGGTGVCQHSDGRIIDLMW